MEIVIIIGGAFIIMLDFIFTLFGKPLFNPGPIAKLMYPELSDEDGYI